MVQIKWSIGDRVRANSRHWARPCGIGTIELINPERRSDNIYYIRFDQKGRGIEGYYLWLDYYNIEPLYESNSTKYSPGTKKSTTDK